MSIAIREEDVRTALEPMLGTRFVTTTPLCAHTAECLRQYIPGRTQPGDLFPLVREVIFGDMYQALGQDMVLTLESGVRLRIRLRDIDTLADAALGVLLDALPANRLPLEALREFALDSGLLCAMRVLLQRYGTVLPRMEKDMFIRIVKENHPADRYISWLDQSTI